MSVFTDLMARAAQLGASHLQFDVDLVHYTEDGPRQAWTCLASVDGSSRLAHGRTGEEALRHVISVMERS